MINYDYSPPVPTTPCIGCGKPLTMVFWTICDDCDRDARRAEALILDCRRAAGVEGPDVLVPSMGDRGDLARRFRRMNS